MNKKDYNHRKIIANLCAFMMIIALSFGLSSCSVEYEEEVSLIANPMLGNAETASWQMQSRQVNGEEQIKDCERNNLITFSNNEQFQEFYVCEGYGVNSDVLGFWIYDVPTRTLILRRDIYGIFQEQAYEVIKLSDILVEWRYFGQDSTEISLQYRRI
ncbi:MAG: hypothetical protein JJT94_02565 [Bernardetiaceae bacterium]|nr:hypothetical protein [Bernardetiaceae bacterium]